MASVVVAGVPEQVNIPFAICRERGIFEKHGLNVIFKTVPEGTGKLLDMIEKGDADVALTVADATISGCAKGRPIQMIGSWVDSPLVWAIAGARTAENDVLFKNGIPALPDIAEFSKSHGLPLRFGISRIGSGSQTMAQYCSTNIHDIPNSELAFEVANDFKGLRAGVTAGKFDAFMWEVFTTKPWFDSGELVYLGEVPTPWPAFVFTTKKSTQGAKMGWEEGKVGAEESGISEQGLSAEKERLVRERLFPALFEGARIFAQEAIDTGDGQVPPSIRRIMEEYGHTEDDARLWMSRCKYNSNAGMQLPRDQLVDSVRILKAAGIVPEAFSAEQLWGGQGRERETSGKTIKAKEVVRVETALSVPTKM